MILFRVFGYTESVETIEENEMMEFIEANADVPMAVLHAMLRERGYTNAEISAGFTAYVMGKVN